MNTPIYNGLLQSDLDCAGFDLLNFSGSTPPSSGSGLDENTVTADDIGLVADGVTDNTSALQGWLDDVNAAQVNSTLLVPDGIYIFSGALQDGGRVNAQIMLPARSPGTQQYSVSIKGYHSLSGSNSAVPFDMIVPKGPVFKSTLAVGSGTQPSFISGRNVLGGIYNEVTTIALTLENMIFETVPNPQISCLNLERVGMVSFLGDVVVISGEAPVQPTTTTSYGVLLPMVNSTNLQVIDNLMVFNFYTGVKIGELTHINNLACWNCYYGVEFGASYHVNLIERYLDYWNPNGIRITGVTPFQIQQHDIERGDDALWSDRVYDIVDPSNMGAGDVTWWTVKTVVGAVNEYDINGGTGIKARRLGSVYP